MQVNSGLRAVLAYPLLYRLAMRLLHKEANLRWFVKDVLALKSGQRIIDIGCGPADILDSLPKGIEYIGLDISAPYIQAAQRKHGTTGLFLSGTLSDWSQDSRVGDADVVLANGMLHHVDDEEAARIFHFARGVLKPSGRFVFYEPCYLRWQSPISKFFMSKDRGQNIRTEQEWKELASVFPFSRTYILADVNRLGYTCILGECHNAPLHE